MRSEEEEEEEEGGYLLRIFPRFGFISMELRILSLSTSPRCPGCPNLGYIRLLD